MGAQNSDEKSSLIPIFSEDRAIPADLEGWLDVFSYEKILF